MSSLIKKKVVIIQEHMPHYRAKFFALLQESLSPHGIELRLIHGTSSDHRMISQALDWANPVKIRKIGPISWHHLGRLCDATDLIIVPQEIKYLRLHLLLLATRFTQCKFAYWGHGKNFQATNPHSPAERFKRCLSRRADWWFAYNELSASVVRALGYPAEQVTTVGNAIDTSSLARQRECVTDAELAAIRSELAITSANVAVYTGGLYPIKRLGFLIEAAERIRERIPDFELIVIGDGPDRRIVSKAASEKRWIHDVGSKNDRNKVPYWMISKLLLMPGGVGLVILDSFALGVPMVTTDTRLHGPEIDYLKDGRNGLLIGCGESVETYADGVVGLLQDEDRLERLRQGALASAADHTIEKMARNFATGVMNALKAPRI